jgi:hypothetical protein
MFKRLILMTNISIKIKTKQKVLNFVQKLQKRF